jgi:hypothetical protein
MSLIDEALKRARQEASRQDAAAREARYARVPTYVAPVRRSRSWLLPGVVAACLAVGGAAGVLLSRSSQGPHPLAPSPATPPALPGRGGTPAEVSAKTKIIPKPEAKAPVIERQRVRAPEPAPAPPPPAPPAPAAPSGPVVDLPQAPPPETRSYVREVPLEGGTVLRLDGIAFSAKPVALFGDKVLAPGESAGGLTVLEIEAKRVKLQGPEGSVIWVSLQ